MDSVLDFARFKAEGRRSRRDGVRRLVGPPGRAVARGCGARGRFGRDGRARPQDDAPGHRGIDGHAHARRRAFRRRKFLIADMPFLSFRKGVPAAMAAVAP